LFSTCCVIYKVRASEAPTPDAHRAAEASLRGGEEDAPRHGRLPLAVQLRGHPRRLHALVAEDIPRLLGGFLAVLAVVERIHPLHRTYLRRACTDSRNVFTPTVIVHTSSQNIKARLVFHLTNN